MNILDLAIPQFPLIDVDCDLADAVSLLHEHGTGVLPVLDEGKFIGTLSETEIAYRLTRSAVDRGELGVAQLYNPNPLICSAQLDLKPLCN